ncbi:MAG: hypothetical protein CMJ78_11820, partial [Planctomycetaceae bacterium]|nr:hypothetical protein [Planctomycetaceae bacterium]
IPRGNPLRNWSPFDFEIAIKDSAIEPKGKSAKWQSIAGNIIMVYITNDDFRVTMEGFDTHRDLFVKVDEVPIEEKP